MTEADIYDGLTDIFHDALGDSTLRLRPDLTAADVPGWDSMKMVAIIVAVESRFAIRLRSREVDGLASVGDLAALVRTKIPSAS